ncbi:hypothetical protein [Methanosarcina sp.]|uniref:hypothetical protein n=1 Tax=Methanosarcina sp. TaxID=2213 RepID=UPI003C7452EC
MTPGRKPGFEKRRKVQSRKETKKRVKFQKNERESGKKDGKLKWVKEMGKEGNKKAGKLRPVRKK